MKIIANYTRIDGKILKVKQNTKGVYIVELYENAQAKKWYQRGTFESKDDERWITIHSHIHTFVIMGAKYRNK
ncbi:MAG: hypothetical protein K6A67_02255 [Bacteroidales bacterium]|nr:hypothetical protein [Bacteroidales bacterium]